MWPRSEYEAEATAYLNAVASKVLHMVKNGELPEATWVNQLCSKIVFLCRSPRVCSFTTTPLLSASVVMVIKRMLEGYRRAIPEVSVNEPLHFAWIS